MAQAPFSISDLFKLFPTDEKAKSWIIRRRWPSGICCPRCGSLNVQTGCKHHSIPYRCREQECGGRFSVRTGTLMEGSSLGFQKWVIAVHLMASSPKSLSSIQLSKILGITQKTAWFLAHRPRKAYEEKPKLFSGPVEVDETYVGGKRKNMSKSERVKLTGRGSSGKAVIVGMKDRDTNQVSAQVVPSTDRDTLQCPGS